MKTDTSYPRLDFYPYSCIARISFADPTFCPRYFVVFLIFHLCSSHPSTLVVCTITFLYTHSYRVAPRCIKHRASYVPMTTLPFSFHTIPGT